MSGQAGLFPPDLDEMAAMAQTALAQLPQPVLAAIGGVALQMADFPDEETLAEIGCESPFELMGLYSGVQIGDKESLEVAQDIDRIFLYRRPILDYWCETGEALDHVIRHVLIHEIGHHLGLSDDDMHAIEDAADQRADQAASR